jgi:hypothetical protein
MEIGVSVAAKCIVCRDLSDFQGDTGRSLLPKEGVDNSQTGTDESVPYASQFVGAKEKTVR